MHPSLKTVLLHPSLKTLLLLITAIVIASLLIHSRSAFGL